MNPNTFRKVSPRFWTGETGRSIRALGHEIQVLALYLLTCPSSDMSGLYYLPLPTLAHECGSSLEGASKGLLALGKLGFAFYEEASEHVFVPEMARIQMGENLAANDKKRLGLLRHLETCKSPFLQAFYDRYRECYKLPARGFEGASKGLPRGIATEIKTEIQIQTNTKTEIQGPAAVVVSEPKPAQPEPPLQPWQAEANDNWRPRTKAEANAAPIQQRAEWAIREVWAASEYQPQAWPEVVQVAEAFCLAYKLAPPKLGRLDQDRHGTRRIIELLTLYTPSQLVSVCKALPDSEWSKARVGERQRPRLGWLSDEVVRTTFGGLAAERPMDPKVRRILEESRAREATA